MVFKFFIKLNFEPSGIAIFSVDPEISNGTIWLSSTNLKSRIFFIFSSIFFSFKSTISSEYELESSLRIFCSSVSFNSIAVSIFVFPISLLVFTILDTAESFNIL